MSIALDNRVFVERPAPPPASVPLWQLHGALRPRATAQILGSAPDVWIFSEGQGRVTLTREWQFFIRDINPNMPINNVSGLLGTHKAFTNQTGFPTEAGEPPRVNWILGEDLNAGSFPQFDKDRSCSFNCHTGTIIGELLQVETLDGNKPPPDVSQINPSSHPWLFFHATIVYKEGTVDPFPHGAPGWGISRPCVWMPLVATHALFVPVSNVTPISTYRLPYT
jgi:hypothetical protein